MLPSYGKNAGCFIEGVLSRATLQQAKPNLSAQQYAEINHVITRSEALMKWFMGTFAQTCAIHNYDFLKNVQRVARFKEYLKSAKVEELDEKYAAMMSSYLGSYASSRVNKVWQYFSGNARQNSVDFFRHFHNSISRLERDQWISFVILGGSSRSSYVGPTFGVKERFEYSKVDNPFMYYDISGTMVIPASTNAAAQLASYMHHFDFWTDSRINSTMDLGDKARQLVKVSGDELFAGVDKSADEIIVREDADFKRTIKDRALYALNKLAGMDDELSNLLAYLDTNTHFLKNRRKTKTTGSLASLIQIRANEANHLLDDIMRVADQHVPKSDSSRQSD